MLIGFLYILLTDRTRSADEKSRETGLAKGLSVLGNLLSNLYCVDLCNEFYGTEK